MLNKMKNWVQMKKTAVKEWVRKQKEKMAVKTVQVQSDLLCDRGLDDSVSKTLWIVIGVVVAIVVFGVVIVLLQDDLLPTAGKKVKDIFNFIPTP